MPLHIHANKDDVAERTIVVGDPARAELISSLLETPRLVNSNRGLLVFTGKWRGAPVTVATHGMGGPGAAIIFEELIQLGVKAMVRLGTTAALKEDVRIGDLVIPNTAHYFPGGFTKMYFGDLTPSAAPSFKMLIALVKAAEKKVKRLWIAPVVSSDAFYAETPSLADQWARAGAVSVEMECATLFLLSMLRGVASGAILVVNGSLAKPSERMASSSELKESILKAGEASLDALLSVYPP